MLRGNSFQGAELGTRQTRYTLFGVGIVMILSLIGCAGNPPPATQSQPPFGKNHPPVLRSDYARVREELIALLEKNRARYPMQGLSLALVDDQEIVWAEGFGLADREAGIPASPRTVYRMGSIAKPLTAMAVMQLSEQDRIDIDQPLAAYLPGFSVRSRFNPRAQPITVRSLLCHHSGLPTDRVRGMWSEQDFRDLGRQLHNEYVAYPANMVFNYSNLGYSLLGHLVNEISGLNYDDYMRERVLRPMAMDSSGFSLNGELQARLARGYRGNERQAMLPIRDRPAFGLYSTVMDLAQAMRTLFAGGQGPRGRVIESWTLEEMMEVQNDGIELDLEVINGLGWFIEKDTVLGAGYVLRHGGTTLLHNSEMILFPEHKLGVVVASNAADTRKLVKILAETVLSLALDHREQHRPPANGSLLATVPDKLELASPAQGGGRYTTSLGMLAIDADRGELCSCASNARIEMMPLPNGWFGLRQQAMNSISPSARMLTRYRFSEQLINGRAVIVAERDGKRILMGEKMLPSDVPAAWLQRVGEYRILNPDPHFPIDSARILLEDGQLAMSYRLPGLSEHPIRLPLQALSENEAVILGLGRMRGETIRAAREEDREYLYYSGYKGTRRP